MKLILIGIISLFISGCVSLPAYTEERQEWLDKVNTLEAQLKEKENLIVRKDNAIQSARRDLGVKRDENTLLRQQIIRLQKALASARKKETRIIKSESSYSAFEIQSALKEAGFYKGEIDGKMNSETETAVKNFQQAMDLVPDGVVGAKTWEILSKYLKEEIK